MTARRLLMCDDEPEVGTFVRRIAEPLGFEMQFTDQAEGFISLYQACLPDVVILDLVMPGTDGIELLNFLAQQRSTARILLMSGFDSRIREAALLLGEAHELNMVGIVPKPVRVAELRDLLNQLAENT